MVRGASRNGANELVGSPAGGREGARGKSETPQAKFALRLDAVEPMG